MCGAEFRCLHIGANVYVFVDVQTTFMAHFGLGGPDVEGGWTEQELRAALISVIESQADEANAAADAAPL